MGAVCCCLRDECEDFAHSNSSICGNFICIRFFVENFLHVYTSLFHREEQQEIALSTQGTTSLSSAALIDTSLVDMYHAPPRPLPYDVDPRYFHLRQGRMVSGREKGSSHSHEETEPLRRSEVDGESESLSGTNKLKEFTCEEGSKECDLKSKPRLSITNTTAESALINTSFEDEDVCPTCLEEYTTENPKIITKCFHHFHLGCIYEWMERSDNCPVCGKEMAFDETT
ncbi:E3 ubiquitin- ligase At3g02290-like [Olea europaea subsp. europaea]|uniref:RING-type E3 ubiquitin transferase n=1 Tax=Olea europaea subsp. europaea TaxID=158383 RepID=A0A8S0SHM9_OLEEU|nr:E3 ubiquitin- ligase At3g02290-like [Olea europaea subsp. europaea]